VERDNFDRLANCEKWRISESGTGETVMVAFEMELTFLGDEHTFSTRLFNTIRFVASDELNCRLRSQRIEKWKAPRLSIDQYNVLKGDAALFPPAVLLHSKRFQLVTKGYISYF
jgi:hypothetical protein